MARHKTGDRVMGGGTTRGRGKLLCNICSAPYSKHELGPACPFALDGEMAHKPSKQPAGRIY